MNDEGMHISEAEATASVSSQETTEPQVPIEKFRNTHSELLQLMAKEEEGQGYENRVFSPELTEKILTFMSELAQALPKLKGGTEGAGEKSDLIYTWYGLYKSKLIHLKNKDQLEARIPTLW